MGQNTPVFDVEHLGATMGGDKALMQHFIMRFLDNARLYIEEIQTCVDGAGTPDGDPYGGTWSGGVHRLKGAARMVGAMRLAAACAQAELIEDDSNTRIDAVRSISGEYDALRTAVGTWLKGL